MGKFLTVLHVRAPEVGGTWELANPLVFESKRLGVIVVPTGFSTDFASVPRIPIAYLFFGDVVHSPAVIHDYLYGLAEYKRLDCDAVFLEAMEDVGVSYWQRHCMWIAVRLFGWAFRTYEKKV